MDDPEVRVGSAALQARDDPDRGLMEAIGWSRMISNRSAVFIVAIRAGNAENTPCLTMRRLKTDPVPNELIRKILQAGVCAPSGGNMQRWRFLVVRDPKIKRDCRGLLQAGLGRASCATVPVW